MCVTYFNKWKLIGFFSKLIDWVFKNNKLNFQTLISIQSLGQDQKSNENEEESVSHSQEPISTTSRAEVIKKPICLFGIVFSGSLVLSMSILFNIVEWAAHLVITFSMTFYKKYRHSTFRSEI